MTSIATGSPCEHSERVALHALSALPPDEARQFEIHLAECGQCRQEFESLRPVVESLSDWPTDVLRPSATVWDRLAQRITADSPNSQTLSTPGDPERLEPQWLNEPQWHKAAPGIDYKLLATDPVRERLSLLVRLAPGAAYPPHTHAGTEELHLLAGELWINGKKLYPGEYNRATWGSTDRKVRTDTGCTCVLITSSRDVLL